MNTIKSSSSQTHLRSNAEENLTFGPWTESPLSMDRSQHELQVYQIELEMQNESLRQALVSLEESRDRYADLYAFAPIAYLTVTDAGLISEINQTGAAQLGEYRGEILNTYFLRFVVPQDQDRWHSLLHRTRQSVAKQTVELSLQRGDGAVLDMSVDCVPARAKGATPQLRLTLTDITERKRAQNELRKRESYLRNIFVTMSEGLLLRNKAGEIVEVNPSAEEILGLTRAEMLGKATIDPRWQAIREDGTPYPCEEHPSKVTLRTGMSMRNQIMGISIPDKGLRWISINSSPLFCEETGSLDAVIATFVDVTEQKRSEINCVRSQAKIQSTLDAMPDLLFEVGRDGRFLDYHASNADLLPIPPQQFLGKTVGELLPAPTAEICFSAMQEATERGHSFGREIVISMPEGERCFELSVAPKYGLDDQDGGFVIIARDITKRKQIDAKLRLKEERLQLAKSASGLGIFYRDFANDKLDCDERAREIWGVQPEEAVTYASLLMGVHPDDRAAAQSAIDKALDPHGSGELFAEFRVVNIADGTIREVAAYGQALFMQGRAVQLVGTIKDVSAWRNMERELSRQRNAMELLIKQQVAAQTAAAIAHELNQPLNSIVAYSGAALNMLRSDMRNSKKLLRALEGAVEQSLRAGQSLRELVTYLHKTEPTLEPIDINWTVREALAIASENCSSGFSYATEFEPDLRPVLATRIQVQKVLVNLLRNGVEAMRGAGVASDAMIITVKTMTRRNMAQVSMQDSGPGLEAATAQRIFDPFFSTKSKGLGLGLSISRALIEEHGGQLWVDTENGPGATFHFTLPFAS